MNHVFQERLDELEVKPLNTGVLRAEDARNSRAVSTFVPPTLETRQESVPAVTQVEQCSSLQEQRSDILARLCEAP